MRLPRLTALSISYCGALIGAPIGVGTVGVNIADRVSQVTRRCFEKYPLLHPIGDAVACVASSSIGPIVGGTIGAAAGATALVWGPPVVLYRLFKKS